MSRSLKETLTKGKRDEAAARPDEQAADPRELIDKYSGMSEEGLMRELISLTNRQKENGSFDRSSIRKGVETLLPMLDDAQKKKLLGIIAGL